MAHKSPERYKVYNNVFDNFTRRTLFELESKGHLDRETLMPFSMGKEANLFWGEGHNGLVVVKIYRLQSCDFNKMYDYIKYDRRFQQVKRQRRKVILAWIEREYRNLLKAHEAQVRAPIPFAKLNNVIVMEMIGTEAPAPKLKDQQPQDPKKFLAEIVRNIRKFYQAGFVHADLSKFNILNDRDKPVLIDFSQATPLTNTNADEYLRRDIHNVSEYFVKIGMPVDEPEILAQITAPKK